MESFKDRPVMTCDELCATGSPGRIPRYALLTAGEFLKMVAMISGQKVTRRTLQFYSSPQVRAAPKAIYLGGHRGHYLHPEHTVSFSVLLHLRAVYFLPLKLAKRVFEKLPAEHYDLLLDDVLSAADLVRLARGGEPQTWIRDAQVGRSARALTAARLIESGWERTVNPAEIASVMVDHQKLFGPAQKPVGTPAVMPA